MQINNAYSLPYFDFLMVSFHLHNDNYKKTNANIVYAYIAHS